MKRSLGIGLALTLALLVLVRCVTEKPRETPPPAPRCMRFDRSSGRSAEVACSNQDQDQDGVDDAVDLCPNTPALARKFVDANGCPAPDADGDQIPDPIDDCAHEAGAAPTGCAEKDSDGDRMVDHLDSCPYAAEDFNGVDDQDGCPDGADVLVVLRQDQIYVRQPIHFLKKSAMLLPDSKEVLDRVAQGLQPYHDRIGRIRVIGHADPGEVGKVKAIALSRTRARIVAKYLIAQGVDKNLFDTEALGSRQPLGKGKRERDRERNQRVELLVTLKNEQGGTAVATGQPDAGAVDTTDARRATAVAANRPDAATAAARPDAAVRTADAATTAVAAGTADAGKATPEAEGEVKPYREEEEWDQEFLEDNWDDKLLKK